jgi:hypothetical protein
MLSPQHRLFMNRFRLQRRIQKKGRQKFLYTILFFFFGGWKNPVLFDRHNEDGQWHFASTIHVLVGIYTLRKSQ